MAGTSQERLGVAESAGHSVQPAEVRGDARFSREIAVPFFKKHLAPADRNVDRCRAEVERRSHVTEEGRPRPAGSSVVLEAVLRRVLPLGVSSECTASDPARHHPRASGTSVVVDRLEHRASLLCDLEQSARALCRLADQRNQRLLHSGAQLQPPVAQPLDLSEGLRRPVDLADGVERDSELAEKLEPVSVAPRQQIGRPAEQPRAAAGVLALPGRDPSRAEPAARILGETLGVPVGFRSKLRRPLEVESDDLVADSARVEQVGRRLVQTRTLGFGRRGVRRLLDEGVAEAESLLERLRRRSGIEQSAPDERGERLAGGAGVEELCDDGGVELPADDRGALDGCALACGQPVEARGQERAE
jgi:hypothetical protein